MRKSRALVVASVAAVLAAMVGAIALRDAARPESAPMSPQAIDDRPSSPGQARGSAVGSAELNEITQSAVASERSVVPETAAATPLKSSIPTRAESTAGSRASGRWKFLPSADAPSADWRARIEDLRERRGVVALEALIEAIPQREDRAHLLAAAATALASLGQDARLAFDDLLSSSEPRDVRLAAFNAFAYAFPAERGPILVAWSQDADRVIQQKAIAMQAALR